MADPIQGLIDFVLAQKPYHTKILDLLVNYTHDDQIDVEFLEEQLFEIGIIFDTEFSDDSGTLESIVEACPKGFGDTWDQPGQFLVVYADDATDTIYLIGDVTASFTSGVAFEVRDPDGINPDLNYTVDSSTYDSVSDRTAVVVNEDVLGGDFIVVVDPGDNNSTIGNVFPVYSVVSTTEMGNMIVLSGTGINVGDFKTGFAVTIRNATEVALNKDYRIIAAVESGVNEVTIFSNEPVLVDTVSDGEAVFAGFGYDEPPFCSSLDTQHVVKPQFAETLDIQTLQEPGATPSFQYFILEADDGADTFTVEGDARDDIAPTDDIDVIHAMLPPYTSFGPYTPSGNNGTHTVTSVTFDPVTNRSVIAVSTNVTDSQPTGWIIPS